MAAPEHNDSAKVFMTGKSQAVRLPRKYRFPEGCDEVSIRRFGGVMILIRSAMHFWTWLSAIRSRRCVWLAADAGCCLPSP